MFKRSFSVNLCRFSIFINYLNDRELLITNNYSFGQVRTGYRYNENLTLQNVVIVSGNIFPAVMRKGCLARIINGIRDLAFLGSSRYHSRSHMARYTSSHLTRIYKIICRHCTIYKIIAICRRVLRNKYIEQYIER